MKPNESIATSLSLFCCGTPNNHIDPRPILLQSSSQRSTLFVTPKRLSEDGRIRYRLLHRLGIDPRQPTRRYIRPSLSAEDQRIHTKTVSTPFFQSLRDSAGTPCATVSSQIFTTDNNDSSNHSNHGDANTRLNRGIHVAKQSPRSPDEGGIYTSRKSVRFDNDVLVVPVPSRHAYSERIKQAFWRSKDEIRCMVDRNRYEYTVEGWNWSNVLEDDEMYLNIVTGEKVHPCWVQSGDSIGEDTSTNL